MSLKASDDCYSGALDDLLSFEKGMLFNAGLDGIIRRTLEPDWHRISHRSKVILLSSLLNALERSPWSRADLYYVFQGLAVRSS